MLLIDAGHGGRDPGAVGKSLKEKDVTLKLAIMLEETLRTAGVPCALTRTEDTTLSLKSRVAFANRSKATHFISLHVNAAKNLEANGVEVYTSASGGERTELAKKVQAALVSTTHLKDRGIKHRAFYVLRNTKQPAILVELGFITNPQEHDLLCDDDFLCLAANAIAREYMAHIGHEFSTVKPTWQKIIEERVENPEYWVKRIKELIEDGKNNSSMDRYFGELIIKINDI